MRIASKEHRMKNPSLGDRLKYSFDKLMSRGLPALIGLLGVVTLIFISLISLVVVIFGLFPDDQKLDFAEAFWATMLRTLDPGTMGGDTGPGYRIAMLIVTLTGLVRGEPHRYRRECVQRKSGAAAQGTLERHRNRSHAHPWLESKDSSGGQ
ncbi:MAG: hypothetical protein EBR52_03270 [Microbacteriaceae bacterium]|nr:hypothetical protein [Microbacteriaceae bacterium]